MNPIKQFIRFTGVGAIGTGVHYGVLIVSVQLAHIDPVVATVIGSITGACINYILNYHFTFKSRKRHREVAPKFFIVAAFGMIINAILLWTIIPYLHYLLAQLCATGTVLIWNFIINRFWTFQIKTV